MWVIEDAPLDLEYENMGAGCARLAWTLPPVPIGPAAALMLPPMVTFPPRENARTASSLLRTMTKSVISAPIWRPQPTPPVAIQDGADHEPSGKRAMTRPEPAFPEKTNPAFRTWKMARPMLRSREQLELAGDDELDIERRYLVRVAKRPWGLN